MARFALRHNDTHVNPSPSVMPHPLNDLVCQTCTSPLGELLLAADADGLAGAWFVGQQHQPDAQAWRRQADHPLLLQAQTQITQYLAGARQTFDVPLSLKQGTAFQQRVWQALQAIPFGQTRSYSDIAQALGAPQAVRAVGAAIGRNPWIMLVPCHRVLGAKGALTGYAAGLARKQSLLSLEAAQL